MKYKKKLILIEPEPTIINYESMGFYVYEPGPSLVTGLYEPLLITDKPYPYNVPKPEPISEEEWSDHVSKYGNGSGYWD